MKTLTTLILLLVLCVPVSTSYSQEMFQDRFGRWHYVDPNERREQAPYIQPREDLYREFQRERRRAENDYMMREFYRYRDCSPIARRC